MRLKLLWLLGSALTLSGCALLETPCGRVAGSICTIPGEDDACQALRAFSRSDSRAQKTCERAEPVAVAYAKDPSSGLRKVRWKVERVALFGAGVIDRLTATAPEKKLGEAAEKAGEAVEEAGEAVGEMIEAMVED